MELIDRDALHQTYMRWFKKESVNNQTVTKSITLADALMKNEPVIEAIPISFIEEQVKLCNEIGFRRGEECYMALIEKWRKENETD